MRCVLLDRIPKQVEKAKDANPAGQPTIGESVNKSGMVQALLEYGTFDRYLYLRNSRVPTRTADLEEYDNAERLEGIDYFQLEDLAAGHSLVLFTSSVHLAKFVPLRELYRQCDMAICGLTHSLSDSYLAVPFLLLAWSRLEDCDALICTTDSARKVIVNALQNLSRSTSLRLTDELNARPQMPVIPLGVDEESVRTIDRREARAALGLPIDPWMALYVGRFSLSNKADLWPLIESFLLNPALPPTSMLLLAGDDTAQHLTPALGEVAGCLGGAARVRIFPDFDSRQKRHLFSAADTFIALSDTAEETFGITVVEAMLAGLSVVASDWNGYRCLIANGTDGLLVPTFLYSDTRDVSAVSGQIDIRTALAQRTCTDLSALQGALTELAANEPLRLRLGQAARNKALARFSWKAVMAAYHELWTEQIQRARHIRLARANSAPHTSPSFLDFSEVFSHYPTYWLSDLCSLRITDYGCRLQNALPLGRIFADTRLPWSTSLDEDILDVCRRRPGITAVELIGALTPRFHKAEIVAHMSRLLKYGILTTESALPARTLN